MSSESRADSFELEPLTLDGSGALELRADYGADVRHEAPRLFEPAPVQMPGQADLFNPDVQPTAGTPAEGG